LWAGNIIISERNDIAAIIDFERSLWGDPLMEYAFGEDPNNNSFLEGYSEDLFASPSAQVRRTLYSLYHYLVLKIECAYRGYQHTAQDIYASPKIAQTISSLESLL
jgi:aminoglycoside phosphotransferase (APT) family kinase protein